ncbi:hypothetical protein RQM59_12690 [Flavobacteriaceae bacterium S356]|uniref:DUF4405 domain-containing protein n=1 Tax=Asprobacillus argus TaxID=3076534 RepID=A0ABU3LJK6_9FLAO|nr:hypothetical protein [Flavobacteriaceae bacterium S356]
MLGKIHFYLGISIVIIFILTGQYMHHNYDHLKGMEQMNRALFRAGHLYILLFGLIHIALGSYFRRIKNVIFRKIQWLGSVILFIASFLVIYGFFTELPTEHIERPLTRMSLYLVLLGISIHGLVSLKKD